MPGADSQNQMELLRSRKGLVVALLTIAAICFWLPAESVLAGGQSYQNALAFQYSAMPVLGILVLGVIMLLAALLRYGRWLRGLALGISLLVALFATMRIWRLLDQAGFTRPLAGLWLMALAAWMALLISGMIKPAPKA